MNSMNILKIFIELIFFISYILVVSDLAETMQSLQTIAEQCLPATWEAENAQCTSEEACDGFDLGQIYKCQFCDEMFKGLILYCL